MSLYQKLRLLVRASAEQPARKLVEMNDIKIFEQELIEIERAIKGAKLHLAKVKAEAKMLTVANAELSDKLMFREQQTLEAMDKDADLAQELAAQIAEDEAILRDQQKQLPNHGYAYLSRIIFTSQFNGCQSIYTNNQGIWICNEYRICLGTTVRICYVNDVIACTKVTSVRSCGAIQPLEGIGPIATIGNRLDTGIAIIFTSWKTNGSSSG